MSPNQHGHVVSSTLARWGAGAGVTSAAVIVVNALKRSGALPPIPPVQLLAPLAEAAAVGFVAILFVFAVRTDRGWHVAASLANVAALSLLAGSEWVLNLVFAYSSPSEIAHLLGGPLGLALAVTSVFFLAATVALAAALASTGRAPRWAAAAYAVGGVVVGLRSFLPPAALPVGLTILALGILGLSVWLWREADGASNSDRAPAHDRSPQEGRAPV